MISALLAAVALHPQTLLTVDPAHRLVEGVATDGKTIWLSSLIDGQILRCRGKAGCKTLATLPSGLHPFAIAWDSNRKRLWVAADCPPGVSFIKACERGAVLAFDTKGRLRARIGQSVGSFHPGDVSVSNGRVFVSDSQSGAVYELLPAGNALAALVPRGVGKSGQGSALDPSGKRLIVADYSQGVTTIDLQTGARTILKRDNDRPLRGIDGVLRCGGSYYAVYNGEPPGAVLRFTVEGERIRFEPVIDGAPLVDPTQLATDGKRLLVVGNAGWELAMKGQPRSEGAPILTIPVDCGQQAPASGG